MPASPFLPPPGGPDRQPRLPHSGGGGPPGPRRHRRCGHRPGRDLPSSHRPLPSAAWWGRSAPTAASAPPRPPPSCGAPGTPVRTPRQQQHRPAPVRYATPPHHMTPTPAAPPRRRVGPGGRVPRLVPPPRAPRGGVSPSPTGPRGPRVRFRPLVPTASGVSGRRRGPMPLSRCIRTAVTGPPLVPVITRTRTRTCGGGVTPSCPMAPRPQASSIPTKDNILWLDWKRAVGDGAPWPRAMPPPHASPISSGCLLRNVFAFG